VSRRLFSRRSQDMPPLTVPARRILFLRLNRKLEAVRSCRQSRVYNEWMTRRVTTSGARHTRMIEKQERCLNRRSPCDLAQRVESLSGKLPEIGEILVRQSHEICD